MAEAAFEVAEVRPEAAEAACEPAETSFNENLVVSLHRNSPKNPMLMPDSQPLVRIYNATDATMRQHQRTLRDHYTANADAFQAFNPAVFDPKYAENWGKSQDAADTAAPGSVRAATLHEATDVVDVNMDKARATAQRLFYAVGQAWPHNAGRLNQYGKNRYEQARTSHDRMIVLLDLAHDAATRPADAALLTAHGWDGEATNGLAALGHDLVTTNTTQQAQKGTGVEDGQDYIGFQNALYRFGQQASLAAKTLFADDFAKRQLFDLTDGGGGGHYEDHELSVKPGETKSVAFTTLLLPETGLHLLLSRPQPGMQATVGRVAAIGQSPTQTVALVPDARSLDVPAAALGPSGQVLVVANTGTRAVRVVLRVSEA